MNKYRKHSKADLTKNLKANVTLMTNRDPIDEFDADHKESLEDMDKRIGGTFKVAKQMFEILISSNLSAEGRTSAMQFLNVLVHRFSGK